VEDRPTHAILTTMQASLLSTSCTEFFSLRINQPIESAHVFLKMNPPYKLT
jgi:hypothetical protein